METRDLAGLAAKEFEMSQVEEWFWISESARLMLHTENDGYACLRHGICAEDRPVDIDRLDVYAARRALRSILAGAHAKGPTAKGYSQ